MAASPFAITALPKTNASGAVAPLRAAALSHCSLSSCTRSLLSPNPLARALPPQFLLAQAQPRAIRPILATVRFETSKNGPASSSPECSPRGNEMDWRAKGGLSARRAGGEGGKARGMPRAVARVASEEAVGLTEEQQQQYKSQGYLVLEGFASSHECTQLQHRMHQLVDAFDPDHAKASVFSTREQARNSNDYFLNSARNISFFFEEKAHGPDGRLLKPKELAINKVAHALHDLDPVFSAFSRSPRMAAILRSLGYRCPLPVQSMYIFKQPGIGGEVVPHQDSTFLYTDPPSCMGIWLALQDANIGNGCLYALPASHMDPIERRFVRDGAGGVTFTRAPLSYDLSAFVPLEVPAGTVVLLHGALVHFSYENTSPVSRHAYTLHVVESHDATYSPDNWLQVAPSDPPFYPLYSD